VTSREATEGLATSRALGRLADALLVLAALPFAGVLVLALRVAHGGLGADQILFFYALPAGWLAGTFLALRSPVPRRLSIALVIVSLGVGLTCAETLVGIWARAAANDQAPPSVLTEVLRLREAGEDAYPRIPGNSLVDASPEFQSGPDVWRPIGPAPGDATIVLCNEDGPLQTYSADGFGFDNPAGAWDVDDLDVVLVGDSYTAGVCVAEEHRIGSRLRASQNVLNLGMSGAGPIQELAVLREYAAPLEPHAVVWIYYEGNDLWDLARETQRRWLRAYLEPAHSQGLLSHRAEVNERFRAWVDSLVASASVAAGASVQVEEPRLLDDVVRFRALRRLTGFGVLFPRRDSPTSMLERVLERARDDVAAWGGTLLLVYMPAFERYDAHVGEVIEGRSELIEFAPGARIPLLDLHEVFLATGDPRGLWASPRGHLSPEGYRIAADAIRRAIASPSASPPGE